MCAQFRFFFVFPHDPNQTFICSYKVKGGALKTLVEDFDFTALSFFQGRFSLTLNERFSINGGYIGE